MQNNNKQSPEDEAMLKSIVQKGGDVSQLTDEQRYRYYCIICDRAGLDPYSVPFRYIISGGKHILYCDRSGVQQLNKLHHVNCELRSKETIDGIHIVTTRAILPDGRYMDGIGAVPIAGLGGDALANKLMFAHTKSCRRATLDLLGLGILDESEVQSIPNAKKLPVDRIMLSPFKRKYELSAEISDAVSKAIDVKEIASLYYVNAERIEAEPELKAEFTAKKNKLYGKPDAEPEVENPINDQDENQRTIDSFIKGIYMQKSEATVNLYFNTVVTTGYRRNPQLIAAWQKMKDKFKEQEAATKPSETAAHV